MNRNNPQLSAPDTIIVPKLTPLPFIELTEIKTTTKLEKDEFIFPSSAENIKVETTISAKEIQEQIKKAAIY